MQHRNPHHIPAKLPSELTETLDGQQHLNPILDIDITKATSNQWIPAVDISEGKDAFVIQADLPGVRVKDVEISLRNGVLTFKGQRITKATNAGRSYFRIERTSGTFYRRFSLPDSVNPNNTKIESDHGVLTITIPKKETINTEKNITPRQGRSHKNNPLADQASSRLLSSYWGF